MIRYLKSNAGEESVGDDIDNGRWKKQKGKKQYRIHRHVQDYIIAIDLPHLLNTHTIVVVINSPAARTNTVE